MQQPSERSIQRKLGFSLPNAVLCDRATRKGHQSSCIRWCERLPLQLGTYLSHMSSVSQRWRASILDFQWNDDSQSGLDWKRSLQLAASNRVELQWYYCGPHSIRWTSDFRHHLWGWAYGDNILSFQLRNRIIWQQLLHRCHMINPKYHWS